jgi:hypothetical protein
VGGRDSGPRRGAGLLLDQAGARFSGRRVAP